MKSYRNLLKMGPGPSSSHTLGPQKAAQLFKETYPATSYACDLLGSLSLTGKGHLTDYIIIETFKPSVCTVRFTSETHPFHANAMRLYAYDDRGELLAEETYFSVGGGTIVQEGEAAADEPDVYPHTKFAQIEAYLQTEQMSIVEYVDRFDEQGTYLDEILTAMLATVDRGLKASGVLPGKLKLKRAAKGLLLKAQVVEDAAEADKLRIMAYAYAASEENASGGICVTAPTLGASGVIPALLYHYYHDRNVGRKKLVDALKVASLFGNLIKENATISGAEGGCQAEIGAAISMGSAMIAFLRGLAIDEIEYAAEMGIEHHLGLTCDPVGGYVMIPCIERNAVGALRCMDNAMLSMYMSPIKQNKVSFDMVVNTMNYTGKKLCVTLKETSLGGLAIEVPMEG
ncbi:MAG: L-serine ammonia-lyase, iron-sulfur-dependent, subunit alpha [Erysipelotrichaceae bacterium]